MNIIFCIEYYICYVAWIISYLWHNKLKSELSIIKMIKNYFFSIKFAHFGVATESFLWVIDLYFEMEP